jgi:hypothetical protein
MAAVVGKSFFVADFDHFIIFGILHYGFVTVCYTANKEGLIFICEAAAWRNVSVGVNV